MSSNPIRLYPVCSEPDAEVVLNGLYLGHRLHNRGRPGTPYIYGNFVASIDGRIALTDQHGKPHVPKSLTTDGDWRLFRELQAQADCLVTHGGYMRALARGDLDDILQIGAEPDDSLRQWRLANGLPEHPAVIVVTSSLNFPIPKSVRTNRQKFHIVTTAAADRTRTKLWRSKGYDVIFCGAGRWVEGRALTDVLIEHGYRSVFLQGGPLIATSLMSAGLLNRLYLTLSLQLLGGSGEFTLGNGPLLGAASGLELVELLYDAQSERGTGQLFACFEPRPAANHSEASPAN